MRDLDSLLQAHQGILQSHHFDPATQRAIRRAAGDGRLTAVLPGVFVSPFARRDLWTLVRALCARHPDAVFTGRAAAGLSYWPELDPWPLTAAGIQLRVPVSWLRTSRRRIPDQLVAAGGGVRITQARLTALDLAEETSGESIDRGLRARAVTLAGMREALELMPGARQPGPTPPAA